jgi:hypothetical protein
MRVQLEETRVMQENVYNMDETGVIFSVLGSSKYLMSAEMQKTHRGAGSKRTLITAVECISAASRHIPRRRSPEQLGLSRGPGLAICLQQERLHELGH